MLLGGDNAVTRPALRTPLPDLSTVGLLTLDAHHDVRGFHGGPTNGTPVRGLIEDGLLGAHVVQVGIGDLTNSRAYRTWCDEQAHLRGLVVGLRQLPVSPPSCDQFVPWCKGLGAFILDGEGGCARVRREQAR